MRRSFLRTRVTVGWVVLAGLAWAASREASAQRPPAATVAGLEIGGDPYHIRFQARPGRRVMTLVEVLDIVRKDNADLGAARHSIEVASGGRITASLRPNPNVTAIGFDLNKTKSSHAVSLTHTFETGDKRQRRTAVADLDVQIAKFVLEDTERVILAATRRTFITVLRAISDLEFGIQTLRNYDILTAMRDSATGGAPTDEGNGQLIRISNERLDLENELDRAALAVELSKHDLGELMAQPTLWAHTDVDGGLEFVPTDFVFDELHTLAFENRPDWKRIELEVRQAYARLRLAEAGKYWNVNIGPQFSGADSGPAEGIGAFLNFSPQVFNRNQGEVEREKANVARVLEVQRQVRLRIEKELRKEFDRYRTNSKILKNYLTRYLDDTRSALQQAEVAFSQGRLPITDFLDTLRVYRSVNSGYRAALAAYLISINDLNFVVGTELISIDEAVTLGEDIIRRATPTGEE